MIFEYFYPECLKRVVTSFLYHYIIMILSYVETHSTS